MKDTKQGVKRTSLPDPWDKVYLRIIMYLTCEGRHNLVHAYDITLLGQLRYFSHLNPEENLTIPHFWLHNT
jgi:hypothetical protein